MNRMLDRLEDSNNSHRAFFSDASHELRSPLSTLVTTAEVASLDKSGKTWLDMQHTVLNESSRMQSLVEDLMRSSDSLDLRRELLGLRRRSG